MDSSQSETIDARVEVNQRALIDKILARYASANAVYRELLQNSNDANATRAEIYFDVSADNHNIVTQVLYRNNGMPFRPQDWTRLQKIAEGNPDPAKVGAFGVGAYSMFSICEEPMVISGQQALAFVWKGDALWSKIINQPQSTTTTTEWTSFCLPSRDPYPLPDLVEFGQFLCANLTFTQSLEDIRLFVNNVQVLTISKTTVQKPQIIQPPRATSWWKADGAVTTTNLFALQSGAIWESRQEIRVHMVSHHQSAATTGSTTSSSTSTITARYVSGTAKTRIPPDIVHRMERVTKKAPPPTVTVQLLLAEEVPGNPKTDAERITASFSPESEGRGRVFIGFRTSQTTGLAAHLQAPLIPTVEREAIDLQDPTLKVYNTELLQICGIILRLTLEHAMVSIGQSYLANRDEREALENKFLEEEKRKVKDDKPVIVEPPRAEKPKEPETTSSSILSFAKYMAKGVKKQIVNVLNSADLFLEDSGDSLLNPRDVLPLSKEERQAIALMQAFCPHQSTPDSQVGTALAMGFSKCLPNLTPPVLTKEGVTREGWLPNLGMESFVPQSYVIRKVVYQNAQEYHDVLCQCRKLTINELLGSLSTQVLEREKAIRLVQWWMKFIAKEPGYMHRSIALKDAIRFFARNDPSKVDSFQTYPYCVTNSSLKEMPMPETVLPRDLQDGIGKSLPKGWFIELPIDVWAQFIAESPCMTNGKIEDEQIRIAALAVICKEWKGMSEPRKTHFGVQIRNLLQNKYCLPFDSSEPTQFAAERPCDLYLSSAELKAFASVGNSFRKVSPSVHHAGVTDDFLVLLGVRKSVAIDFLFAHLDTLKWSDDPKPLVEYLRSATLTRDDVNKLQTTQYLPAENDVTRTFAPRELHFPNSELRLFPFVRLLQWPSDDELTPKSTNGQFLAKLGMKTYPELLSLLKYISAEVKDNQIRVRCLGYLAKNLGPGGVYESQWRLIGPSILSSLKIMPCLVNKDVFVPASKQYDVQSPLHCYLDTSCLAMGFSVVDPSIDIASRFKVQHQPDVDLVLSQLMHLVSAAKSKLAVSSSLSQQKEVLKAFDNIFNFMSQRSNEFGGTRASASLKQEKFIPCLVGETIEWFEPENVYFKNSTGTSDNMTESLFHVVEFSPFLAAVGVKSEASTADLFRLMLSNADKVLQTVGSEEKYRMLLRRIAANPPFDRTTPQICDAPFLLAYRISQDEDCEEEKHTYVLAKAKDIYLIDNSFLARMFPVLRAPHESDLEAFYATLGSPYISKIVKKSFQILGSASSGTVLSKQLAQRLEERRPLLVTPSVTSRPLVPHASKLIEQAKLHIFEVENLKAVYSLNNSTRNQRVTCCTKPLSGSINGLYVTAEFDWFDVGYAVGGLILQRCQLEDAFFIGSLLEAPLEQLRSRGFPVDRILTPPEPMPKPISDPVPVPLPSASSAPALGGSSSSQASAQGKQPDVTSKPSDPKSSSSRPVNQDNGDPTRIEGVSQILKQMFPDCDGDYIRNRLGKDASMENVRQLAEEMAENGYPKQHASQPEEVKKKNEFLPPDFATANQKQKKLGRRLGQALSGIRSNVGDLLSTGSRDGTMAVPPSYSQSSSTDGRPIPPEIDAASHTNMEQMLKSTIGRSAPVNPKGIQSNEQVSTQLPEGLNRPSDGCEVIPGQSLKAFSGPYYSGKTHNGIRVFSARHSPSSENFLLENFHAVDSFADVLQHLCGVYQLNLSSVAIFHDPSGGTIAFNASRALHFNVRFFHSLHYNKPGNTRECYAYWFTTFAHELAHHLVSHHNKEHGFYTESYVTLYLPKLVLFLTQHEATKPGASVRS